MLIAIGGVAIALWTGLDDAPPDAWRGDLVMAAATLCMALYNVWSKPLMMRSSMLGFLATGMGFGAAASVVLAWFSGGFESTLAFSEAQWAAVICLGVFGGAAAFYLAASLLAAALIGEPLGAHLLLGIGAVGAGIWLASTEARR